MAQNPKVLLRKEALAVKLMYATLAILKENGRSLPWRQLVEEVGKRVELDDWARSHYEKSQYIRWQAIMHFRSIKLVKAGYLIKRKGVWYLTADGEAALAMKPAELFGVVEKAYREWQRKNKPGGGEPQPGGEIGEEIEIDPPVTFDQVEQIASEGIRQFILKKNPYEFQELVAALFRGMGYYTPFVAPRGKDGGVDVVAYRDPFGTESPRIKAQVKHQYSPSSVKDIRELMGILQKQGDVGIFISTGGFTGDAKSAIHGSSVHVELLDLDRFIALWQEFYSKLPDEDKNLMPLVPVYFLAPNE
jgi:restriction system protein